MSSGAKDSIPSNVRKMVQNIKEIAESHSDEEIYAMLKECSMDPNETAQKLLLEDKFHEVKRKRDRKKETLSSKESAESRWRPGTQTRGSKGGRASYFPRYAGNDTAGGRSSASGKENGTSQVLDKEAFSSSSTSQETKNKETSPATSSHTVTNNGPIAIASESTGVVHGAHLSVGSLVNQSDEGSTVDIISKSADPPTILRPVNAKESYNIDFQTDEDGQLVSSLSNSSAAGPKAPPAVQFSASDPVLVPPYDSWLPGAVGTIKREVGSQRVTAEQNSVVPPEGKPTAAAYEDGNSLMQGNVPNKPVVVGKNKHPDSVHAASSTHVGSSVIRPSYNYNSRLQQAIGPQKVGPAKEWKPKPTNLNSAQGSGTAGSSEVATAVEAVAESHPVSNINDSREATSKLQKKLEELHISDGQHVIIPNHLHVPEAEKIGFVFGSFDASFSLDTGRNNSPENDRTSAPGSETPKSFEEVAEQSSSNQNQLAPTEEGDYPNNTQSPRHVPEDLSAGEGGFSSTGDREYGESKQETVLPSGSYQSTTVHSSPSYSFGFMPPVVGGQLAQFETSESQTHDVSRLPSFVVPQPLDPASYYAQFYRSGADSDGRISPFHPPAVATKYNGNVAMLSPQTSQTAQESGNPLATAAPALVTQAAGVMQSSIPVTQQPLPVFRQPTGLPITHYPPNYIPYGHYFSPIFVPPPPLHQFLGNSAFPPQPQVGGIYPAPTGAATKYPLSQYKAGSNSGNSTHVGVPNSYGPYGSSPAGYNPSSSSAAGNSTANEDLSAPQFKETNVYMTGQQSEGSAVWIATPGRDISGLQAGSFYNIPPQGQVTFTPTQGSHGTFAGIYHPAQAVSAASIHPLLPQSQTVASAADIVGPTASVYQQPQHSHINWPNNY